LKSGEKRNEIERLAPQVKYILESYLFVDEKILYVEIFEKNY